MFTWLKAKGPGNGPPHYGAGPGTHTGTQTGTDTGTGTSNARRTQSSAGEFLESGPTAAPVGPTSSSSSSNSSDSSCEEETSFPARSNGRDHKEHREDRGHRSPGAESQPEKPRPWRIPELRRQYDFAGVGPPRRGPLHGGGGEPDEVDWQVMRNNWRDSEDEPLTPASDRTGTGNGTPQAPDSARAAKLPFAALGRWSSVGGLSPYYSPSLYSSSPGAPLSQHGPGRPTSRWANPASRAAGAPATATAAAAASAWTPLSRGQGSGAGSPALDPLPADSREQNSGDIFRRPPPPAEPLSMAETAAGSPAAAAGEMTPWGRRLRPQGAPTALARPGTAPAPGSAKHPAAGRLLGGERERERETRREANPEKTSSQAPSWRGHQRESPGKQALQGESPTWRTLKKVQAGKETPAEQAPSLGLMEEGAGLEASPPSRLDSAGSAGRQRLSTATSLKPQREQEPGTGGSNQQRGPGNGSAPGSARPSTVSKFTAAALLPFAAKPTPTPPPAPVAPQTSATQTRFKRLMIKSRSDNSHGVRDGRALADLEAHLGRVAEPQAAATSRPAHRGEETALLGGLSEAASPHRGATPRDVPLWAPVSQVWGGKSGGKVVDPTGASKGVVFWLGLFLGVVVCEVERRRLVQELMKERDAACFLAQVAAFEWTTKQEAVRDSAAQALDMHIAMQQAEAAAVGGEGLDVEFEESSSTGFCSAQESQASPAGVSPLVGWTGGPSGGKPGSLLVGEGSVGSPPMGTPACNSPIGTPGAGEDAKLQELEGQLNETKEQLAGVQEQLDWHVQRAAEADRTLHQAKMLRVCLELAKSAKQRAKMVAEKYKAEMEETEVLFGEKSRASRLLMEENEALKRELQEAKEAAFAAAQAAASAAAAGGSQGSELGSRGLSGKDGSRSSNVSKRGVDAFCYTSAGSQGSAGKQGRGTTSKKHVT